MFIPQVKLTLKKQLIYYKHKFEKSEAEIRIQIKAMKTFIKDLKGRHKP